MIAPGSKVKDLLTPFTGIAVSRTEFMYGCARVGVQANKLGEKGEPMPVEYFDEQRLLIKTKAKFKWPETRVKLGNRVRDSFTSFEGIAHAITVNLAGEVTITIENPKLQDGKPRDLYAFKQQRVEVLEKTAPPVSKDSSATSGGPQRAAVATR